MQCLKPVSDWIAGSPVATLLLFLGAVLGIIGFPLMILLYLKGKRVKRLEYLLLSSQPLVDNWMGRIKGLEVTYQKQPIESLAATLAIIVNTGTVVVEQRDVSATGPITLMAEGGHSILDVQFLEPLNKAGTADRMVAEVADNRGRVTITFDYLDPHQYIWLGVLHTGSSADIIRFTGKVKGGHFGEARPSFIARYMIRCLFRSKGVLALLLNRRKTSLR